VIGNREGPCDENEQPEVQWCGRVTNHEAVLFDEVREEETGPEPRESFEWSGWLSVGDCVEGPDEGHEEKEAPTAHQARDVNAVRPKAGGGVLMAKVGARRG